MLERIDVKTLDQNVCSLIGDQWMLITAGTPERCNTMTASWGGLGVLWGTNVATCYIRPQRYTREFVEREAYFTLAFFGEEHRKALALCGARSGRDIDKVKETGLTPLFDQPAPYFEQARLVLICRKLYTHDLDPAAFLDPAIAGSYKDGDYHRMFVGEIVKVLEPLEKA